MTTTADTTGARILAWSNQLARFSDSADYLCRAYLTPEHRAANDQVAHWMQAIDMTTWEDAAGNLWGRYPGQSEGPALVLGSHLDTVRNAGQYDGMLGVLVPLMALNQLHAAGQRPAQPVELVAFADEEGTRFGTTLLGSRAVTGQWQTAWHSLEDAQGITLEQALHDFGLDPTRMGNAARDSSDMTAYVELHIEQGPVLEDQDLALGVVTSINGARRLKLTVQGQAGHAGTVPMHLRQDALAGASEAILAIEQLALDQGVVATVGQLEVLPGSVNVIPGQCTFTLDIRSDRDDLRDHTLDTWLGRVQEIMHRRQLTFTHEQLHAADAVPCDPNIQDRLASILTHHHRADFRLPSGAGHDAMAMAAITPVGMLFMRCTGGISHNPAESVTEDDVTAAVDVVSTLLLKGLHEGL